MPYIFPHLLACGAVLAATCLSGCSEDYPLVANGYSKTADLSALDADGRGNFAEPIPPKSCLLAFRKRPHVDSLAIRVVVGNDVDLTYSSVALSKALGSQDFTQGVFVVDESGLRFETHYDCDTKIR